MDNMSNIKNTTDLFLRKIQTVSIDGRGITGLASGIEELDKITHGFQEGDLITIAGRTRSEERRVGKECRSRWSPYH